MLDLLATKYGLSRAQAAEAEGRVAALARAEGLEFSPDRPVGNTRAAHRLLQYAQAGGRGQAMISALYGAYFGAGRSVFDADGLIAAAADAGLGAVDVQATLTDDRYGQQISADLNDAGHLGLTGVPFYVIGGTRGVPDAQPAEVFLAALEAAWADAHPGRPAASPVTGPAGPARPRLKPAAGRRPRRGRPGWRALPGSRTPARAAAGHRPMPPGRQPCRTARPNGPGQPR